MPQNRKKVQTGQKSTDFKRIYLVSSNFLELIHGFESQEIEIREFRKKLRVIYLYFHDPNSFASEIEKIEQKEIQAWITFELKRKEGKQYL